MGSTVTGGYQIEPPSKSGYEIEPPQQTAQEAGFFQNVGQGIIGAGKSILRGIPPVQAATNAYDAYAQASGKPASTLLEPSNKAQKMGGYAETAAELALGAMPTAVAAEAALPNAQRAGKLFQQVEQHIGQIPIDTTQVMAEAQRAKELSALGHEPAKPITDFLRRMTPKGVEFPFGTAEAPGNPAQLPSPMTFQEGRDLYSAASRFTAEQMQKLSGKMQHQVIQFADALDTSLRNAAASMTEGERYAAAMKEFHEASDLGRKIDVLKKWGIPAVGIPLLGTLGYKLGQTVFGEGR